MDYATVIFITVIVCILYSSAQDFQPNIWSVDSGGNVGNMSGVTFFHSNPPQGDSSVWSMWDTGTKKQSNTQENTISVFSSGINSNTERLNQEAEQYLKPNDLPFDTSSSTKTTVADRNSQLKNRLSSVAGIPVVSMKTIDQVKPVQSSETFFNFSFGIGADIKTSEQNDTNNIFDLSQFGIKDEELPSQNTSDVNFQSVVAYKEGTNSNPTNEAKLDNKMAEIPFEGFQSITTKNEPETSMKGPTLKVVSGFQDHANKPMLRARGNFIDFTVEKNSDSEPRANGGFINNILEGDNFTDSNIQPRLTAVALPGVQETDNTAKMLALIQVKPFKSFVTETASTTEIPKTTTEQTTAVTTDTKLNSPNAKVIDSPEIRRNQSNIAFSQGNFSEVDLNSITNTNTNSQRMPEQTATNTFNGDKPNLGGAMVINHLNAVDITNDLFNNRVTGPVPDGIPPGEKLKIDSLYPDITDANHRNIPSMNNGNIQINPAETAPQNNGDANMIDHTANRPNGGGSVIVPANSGSTVNDGGVFEEVNRINKYAGGDVSNNMNSGVLGTNQNVQNGVPPDQPNNMTENKNSMQGEKTNLGLQVNNMANMNGHLINNNVLQPTDDNGVQAQNWQGRTNLATSNAPMNTNFIGNGGQQLVNSQLRNNGIPVQGTPFNNGNSIPIFGNTFTQNRANNFQNGMTLVQNGQTVQPGINSNGIPNTFNNFQTSSNIANGIPVISNNGNTFTSGPNIAQLNNNIQRNPQLSLSDGINGQFRTNQGVANGPRNEISSTIPFSNINRATGFQNTQFVAQNGVPGIQNGDANSVMNRAQILQNNAGQGNAFQNTFMNNQLNDMRLRNSAFSQSSINMNRVNAMVNGDINNPSVDTNNIVSNNMAFNGETANAGRAVLDSNAVLNNRLSNGQTINNGIPHGVPSSVEVPIDNTNRGAPMQSNSPNNIVDSNNPMLNINGFNAQNTPIGIPNSPNIQTNVNNPNRNTQIIEPNAQTNPDISQSNQANGISAPNGQLVTTNIQDATNQGNVFSGPNIPIVNNGNRMPNGQVINNVQQLINGGATIPGSQQQDIPRIPPVGIPVSAGRNMVSNMQSNQNIRNMNPNQINPNSFQNQNINLQQMAVPGLGQNVQNMQNRNSLGMNGAFRGQNPAQNMFPNMQINAAQNGLPNGFQNGVANIPFGQNPPFVSGPVNNFQNMFMNGPPRNFPGQFANSFPNNFGQFRQPVPFS